MFSNLTKGYFLVLVCFGLAFNSHAQFKGAFHIGSIGGMGLKQTVFTGSVVISDSSCFSVSNGVSTLKHHTKVNPFTMNCELLFVDIPVIEIVAYPNPTTSHVIVQTAISNPLKKSNQKAQIELYDLSGRLIKAYHSSLFDLNSGYQINLTNLGNGPYFIKVLIPSAAFVTTLKIIKVD